MNQRITKIRGQLKVLAKTVAKRGHENQAINIEIVYDLYLQRSIKSGKRLTHGNGEISQRVHIKRVDQKMLSGVDCAKLFNNP